jgi:hypothetical protein
MTFLQLCQGVNKRTGLQGTFTAVASATGYQAILKEIVADAWVDIQNLRGGTWYFLRDSQTFNTVQSQTEYTITNIFGTSTSPVGSWATNMILYDNDSLRWMDYNYYIVSEQSSAAESTPALFAIDPVDQHLYINPPAAVYSITAHYFAKPTVLSADADVPLGGSEFHYAILYKATADMALFLGNSGLYQLYNAKADAVIGSLLRHSNPQQKIRNHGIA